MIQFIVSGALPERGAFRTRCLANPDALLRIAKQAVKQPTATDLCDEFSAVLHDIRMGGVWKRTARGRLKRTEEMLCNYMPRNLVETPVFLDIGASDGVTTVEALRALRGALKTEVRALLADLNLTLLRYRRGPIVEYRASDGEPIMTRVGRLGIRLSHRRREAEAQQDRIAELYLQSGMLRRSMRLDERISLVNPLAQNEPGVSIMELNCLVRDRKLEGRIAAVRASNVLNIGYFDESQLCIAVENLHAYLQIGGCLVVSRNDDQVAGGPENGSVWVKEAQRFRWAADFGAGSEIRSLVDSWASA